MITGKPRLTAPRNAITIEIRCIARLWRAWVDVGIGVIAIANGGSAHAQAIDIRIAIRVGANGAARLG